MSDYVFRVAREFDVIKIRLTKEVKERVERLRSETRCTGCERKLKPGEKVTLGQCPSCYQATWRAIRRKVVTLVELIRTGKAIPPSSPGRKPQSSYAKDLQEMGQ